MRVAVFTPYLPYPPDTGGKIRSYYLLRTLAARFEVDIYTVYCGDPPAQTYIEMLQRQCGRVIAFHLNKRWRTRDRLWRVVSPLPRSVDYFHTADSLEKARKRLHQGAYDVIVADEICMTPYAELAPELPRIVLRQKVDHIHYLDMARARSLGTEKALDLIEAYKLRRYERAKMPFFQAYLACSAEDATTLSHFAPRVPALVVPNGADLSTFVPSTSARPQSPIVLYVGSMSYYPNVDAVRFLIDEMYRPIRQEVVDVQFQIVGHDPPRQIQELARLPGVEVTGTVPEVRPYYDRATVFVVPLRLGGGTRLKIVEAMAMGLPVVSTSVGAEGLDVQHEQNILLADDAASFSKQVLRLLSDRELRSRIAEGGQTLARHYDWTEITKPWADLVQDTVERWGAQRQ